MQITAQVVAGKIREYLAHGVSSTELVDWAETALIDAEFEAEDPNHPAEIVGRLGAADVQDVSLTLEDYEALVGAFGYELHLHPELVKRVAV